MVEESGFKKEELAKVLGNSYSPFSKFKVAACIESKAGDFYYGCNVENSTIGATICAERTGIVKMISTEGPKAQIERVYILSETEEPISPCGICRQSIFEFVEVDADIEIISFSKDFKQEKLYKLSVLFPDGFRL
ncbi:MAG: cytidine deaminase [Bdellovibrionales bacterium]